MPLPSSSGHSRDEDIGASLKLMGWLLLAVVVMLVDARSGWLRRIRETTQLAVEPLWQIAGLPGRVRQSLQGSARDHRTLAAENVRLRNELLVQQARIARLQAIQGESARLRTLLGAVQEQHLDVQLVPILDIDLDPFRQRLVLGVGSRQGVRQGQVVIDAGGLLGQVTAVQVSTATVLLVTDPAHAVPVAISRNGIRLIAEGDGRHHRLRLVNIPLSADVKVGDQLVTSGLGERFPAGFAVGTIRTLQPDDSRAFLVGDVDIAARLDRGRDVLLLKQVRAPLPNVPPPPPPPPMPAGRVPTPAGAPAAPAASARPSPPTPTAATTAPAARP